MRRRCPFVDAQPSALVTPSTPTDKFAYPFFFWQYIRAYDHVEGGFQRRQRRRRCPFVNVWPRSRGTPLFPPLLPPKHKFVS